MPKIYYNADCDINILKERPSPSLATAARAMPMR